MPSTSRVFQVLAGDAIRDAMRRRVVPVIAAVSLLSLVIVDGCTACGPPSVVQDGVAIQLSSVAGWAALVIFAVLALWVIVLAGVLASDHLAAPLDDGSASLVLARPVGRPTFALTRLVGVLAIAFLTGAVLLGGSAALLHGRHGVPVEPAIWAGVACALGAVSVAALAMTASLFLARIATALLMFASVWLVAGVNAAALFGVKLGGIPWGIDRFGPPLGSAIAAALGPWIAPARVPVDSLELVIRSVAWAVASVSLLVVVFRRSDVPS